MNIPTHITKLLPSFELSDFCIHQYPFWCNTYEQIDNLLGCAVFEDYIDNFQTNLQLEIEENNEIMTRKLATKISTLLATSTKKELLKRIESFSVYKFKAYQTMCHLVPFSEEYYKIYDELFIDNAIKKRELQQRKEIERLELSLFQNTPYEVNIANEIDFSWPSNIEYITGNLSSSSYTPNHISNSSESFPNLAQLAVFKTKDRGWGLKTLVALPEDSFVVECIGQNPNYKETEEPVEKPFLFPKSIGTHKSFFFINVLEFNNESRLIKHSCDPNCSVIHLKSNSDASHQNLLLIAIRPIQADEEITINYECVSKHSWSFECFCGSKSCNDRIQINKTWKHVMPSMENQLNLSKVDDV